MNYARTLHRHRLLGCLLGAVLLPVGCEKAAPSSVTPPVAVAPVALPNHAPAGFDRRRSEVPRGALQTITYDSKSVGVQRRAVVYTPPDYDTNQTYPVLFLMHGINANETQWTRGGGAANVVLDNLYADRKIVPMIVIFPNGRANPNPTGGDPFADYAAFEKDLLNDLIPYVESHFPVKKDRNSRALAGLSMGGGQALNFGMKDTDVFGWVGGFSAAPDLEPPATLVPEIQAAKDKLNLLWIGCGDADGLLGGSYWLHQALDTAKVDHIWYLDSGAHTFAVWHNNLYLFSQIIFKPMGSVLPPPHAGVLPAGGVPPPRGRGAGRRGGRGGTTTSAPATNR